MSLEREDPKELFWKVELLTNKLPFLDTKKTLTKLSLQIMFSKTPVAKGSNLKIEAPWGSLQLVIVKFEM